MGKQAAGNDRPGRYAKRACAVCVFEHGAALRHSIAVRGSNNWMSCRANKIGRVACTKNEEDTGPTAHCVFTALIPQETLDGGAGRTKTRTGATTLCATRVSEGDAADGRFPPLAALTARIALFAFRLEAAVGCTAASVARLGDCCADFAGCRSSRLNWCLPPEPAVGPSRRLPPSAPSN